MCVVHMLHVKFHKNVRAGASAFRAQADRRVVWRGRHDAVAVQQALHHGHCRWSESAVPDDLALQPQHARVVIYLPSTVLWSSVLLEGVVVVNLASTI